MVRDDLIDETGTKINDYEAMKIFQCDLIFCTVQCPV